MKNIFVALALCVAVGVSAQTKSNATPSTKTEAVTQVLSPDAAAERDMKALTAIVTIDESVKADLNKIFVTKYRAKEDTSLSAERLTELSKYVENSLLNFIGESNFAKVKANTKLYNQLVK